VATGEKIWYKNKLWYFFNSLKLTLGVLITLAVVSIIGTVIEQNQQWPMYVTRYGATWAKVIKTLRLYDMYHAKWFLFLLALLTLNIIVCTFERFPPKWKSLLKHKPSKYDPQSFTRIIENCSQNHSVNFSGGKSAAKERVLLALKKKKFNVVEYDGDGSFGMYAWKGAIGRLGSDFTHISLLLILLGAIVGSFSGYKDFKIINVGDTVDVPYNEFKVRLDKFWIDYYESGQIRQFNSMLTVVENGKDVLTKQIWVNEQLYYKGVRFYQSSYGQSWSKIEEAGIGIVNRKTGEAIGEPITIKWDEMRPIPGTKYSMKLVAYSADLGIDEQTKTVFSQSQDPNNPAVGLEIYENGKQVKEALLLLKYPGVFKALPTADKDLVLTGYRGIMYSGVSLNNDPGTNIVWAGSIVMGIGFFFAFFVFHRKVWVNISETGSACQVKFGGIINKNNLLFEKELQDIADGINNSGSKS
jgi:cytochrome c biogenesis protein